MSRIEYILSSLNAVGDMVQAIIPEDHHYYRHYDFVRVMFNSVNRATRTGEEISEEVLSYLERLVEDVIIAVESYERQEETEVFIEEWSVFEYLMSFFSSPSYNNLTDIPQLVSNNYNSENEMLGRYYSGDDSKI
jgi:hypothetical protein